MKKHLVLLIALFLCLPRLGGQNFVGTCLFAERDTCNLYFDVYAPTPGSETTLDGKAKPTIMFVFGGGFVGGARSSKEYHSWFKLLNDNGYRVVTIDYRLGLKGVDVKFSLFNLLGTAKATKHAVDLGVEDVYSAVAFLASNPEKFDVDVNNLVLAGSSAGAMISLSSELEICNKSSRTSALPEDFNFVGVMSFAGAIMSDQGRPAYKRTPCPQMLIHGTADKTVNYKKTQLFNWGIFGTDILAGVLQEGGYNSCIYRFKDHNHDMASNFVPTWPEQKRFLEENVIRKNPRNVDALVDDPAIPSWDAATLDSLY